MSDEGRQLALAGKVALVTGAARGIGRVMALALADAGAVVWSCDIRRPALGSDPRILDSNIDVSDPNACLGAARDVISRSGRIDILVNNAALGMGLVNPSFPHVAAQFWRAEPDTWRQIIDTNLNGPYFMTRAVAPLMIAQRSGRIINISTSLSTMIRPGYAPYGPSKAALEAASAIWAADLASYGITVNVLLPGGATDTEMITGEGDERLKAGPLLDPAIMAEPVVWLASDAAGNMTGQRFIARHWRQAATADAVRSRGTPIRRIFDELLGVQPSR